MLRWYPYRFEFFFFSLLVILFGSLLVPTVLFEQVISPDLFNINILAGILLLFNKKFLMWFVIILLVISAIAFGLDLTQLEDNYTFGILKMASYFLFYIIVTTELISQVWKSKIVNRPIIFGLISGYISLGLIGFFIFLSIELLYPNSFSGFVPEISNNKILMNHSFISLFTIGHGDIIPVTIVAQKSSILI